MQNMIGLLHDIAIILLGISNVLHTIQIRDLQSRL